MLPPVQMQRALPPGLPQASKVVDGSVVPHVSLNAPGLALPVVAPAPAQARPARKARRTRSPERYPVYLAIFTVVALLITIAACYALLLLATTGVHSLLGR